MMVSHLLLVISTTPVTIHDKLKLIIAWDERLHEAELVHDAARQIHSIHSNPLLPVIKGAHYVNVVSTLAPGEHMLHGPDLLNRRRLWLISMMHHLLLLLLLLWVKV